MADRITRCRPLLGTFVEVTASSQSAIDAAFGAIERVHRLMSAHEAGSDISELNRSGHERAVELHPWTARVLERAVHWARHSRGIFDVVRAGKAAIDRGDLPMHPGQPLPQAAHWTWLELTGRAARLMKPGCIDLGGIAKGFAVDCAVDALKSAGAAFGFVNAGGDVSGFGSEPWLVQVVDPATRRPFAEVEIENGALATSAVLPAGEHAHLVGTDPELVSATVCARSAMDADALTKIVLSGSPLTSACLDVAGARAFTLACDGRLRAFEGQRQAA
ncbi:MAG TPA: FAD:protein FMN transferase [Sphingomicrobium sp.]|nr:FAD:protein FMN transferase [Sphingomicrobium sp.]